MPPLPAQGLTGPACIIIILAPQGADTHTDKPEFMMKKYALPLIAALALLTAMPAHARDGRDDRGRHGDDNPSVYIDFAAADQNRNGFISSMEKRRYMRTMENQYNALYSRRVAERAERELARLYFQADYNGDGGLSLREYNHYLTRNIRYNDDGARRYRHAPPHHR